MPCRPGPLPVMKVVHAAGVMGGWVEYRMPELPSFTSRVRLGIRPESIIGVRMSKVAPSRPMISTLSAAGKKSRRGSAKTAGVGVWFAPEAANVPPEASETAAAAVGTAVFRFVSLIGRTVSPDHVLRQLAATIRRNEGQSIEDPAPRSHPASRRAVLQCPFSGIVGNQACAAGHWLSQRGAMQAAEGAGDGTIIEAVNGCAASVWLTNQATDRRGFGSSPLASRPGPAQCQFCRIDVQRLSSNPNNFLSLCGRFRGGLKHRRRRIPGKLTTARLGTSSDNGEFFLPLDRRHLSVLLRAMVDQFRGALLVFEAGMRARAADTQSPCCCH